MIVCLTSEGGGPISRAQYFHALWLLGGLLTGCGEDLTAPGKGAIEVTSVTAGDPTDPDGYTLALDGVERRVLGTNSTLTVADLLAGDHALELGGMAPNCVLTGPNPRTVAVTGGTTARTEFELACNTPTGSIELTTATTGESPDPDGYSAALDGGPTRPIGSNETVTFVGRRCLFSSNESGLWVISPNGGSPNRIDNHAATGRTVWSPDGSAIAFAAAEPNGTTMLRVIPSGGGAGVELASSPGSEYPESWK